MYDTYLIYGEDYSLIKDEIDNITKGNYDIIKYDLSEENVSTILNDASCISMFGNKKIIIGENFNFLTTSTCNIEHDIAYLEKYLLVQNHDNIIIFVVQSDKLDERKKVVKLLKNNVKVIHKEKINEKKLPSFVIATFKNKGYIIDNKTANYFIEYVGNNVDIIISEIKKMILYKQEDKSISIKDINDISCKMINDNVFDLCNAIMKKDYEKIFSYYKDLLTLKMEPSKIISIIATQFLFMYQVKMLQKEGKTSSEISKILDAHPYRVSLYLNIDYMPYELEDILKKLYNLDYEIKSGKADRFNALESFFINL